MEHWHYAWRKTKAIIQTESIHQFPCFPNIWRKRPMCFEIVPNQAPYRHYTSQNHHNHLTRQLFTTQQALGRPHPRLLPSQGYGHQQPYMGTEILRVPCPTTAIKGVLIFLQVEGPTFHLQNKCNTCEAQKSSMQQSEVCACSVS